MGHLLATWGSLLVLGLVMGFSPTTYALFVAVLTGSRRPRAQGLVLVAGVGTGAAALVVLFQVANPDTWVSLLHGKVQTLTVRSSFDLVAGVVFVAVGLTLLSRRRDAPDRATKLRTHVERDERRLLDDPRLLFTTVAVNTAVGASAVATTYLAVRVMRAAESPLVTLIGVVVYLGGTVGPYLVILALWQTHPGLARVVTAAVDRLRGLPWRRISGTAVLAVGVALIVSALVRLR